MRRLVVQQWLDLASPRLGAASVLVAPASPPGAVLGEVSSMWAQPHALLVLLEALAQCRNSQALTGCRRGEWASPQTLQLPGTPQRPQCLCLIPLWALSPRPYHLLQHHHGCHAAATQWWPLHPSWATRFLPVHIALCGSIQWLVQSMPR